MSAPCPLVVLRDPHAYLRPFSDFEAAADAVAELVATVRNYEHTTARLILEYPVGTPIPGSELDLRRKQREQMFAALAKFGGGK